MEIFVTRQSQRVLRDALELTPTDRAELVERILASFELSGRKEVDAAWAQKAEARIDAYERGEIEATTAEEVFSRIDRLAGKSA